MGTKETKHDETSSISNGRVSLHRCCPGIFSNLIVSRNNEFPADDATHTRTHAHIHTHSIPHTRARTRIKINVCARDKELRYYFPKRSPSSPATHPRETSQFKEIGALSSASTWQQSFSHFRRHRAHTQMSVISFHISLARAMPRVYVRAFEDRIVRFHCDLIESRVITPGSTPREEVINRPGIYREVKPTFFSCRSRAPRAPRDSTLRYDPIPRYRMRPSDVHTCARRVTRPRPVDFLHLHFGPTDKKEKRGKKNKKKERKKKKRLSGLSFVNGGSEWVIYARD